YIIDLYKLVMMVSCSACPGVDQRDKVLEAADHGIWPGVRIARNRTVRDQHGPHADALGAVHVVEGTVADEDAFSRVRDADGGHRGAEGFRMRLGPADLAGVDGAVDEVKHPITAENVLVPAARPHRVGQHADPDPAVAQVTQQSVRL